MVVSVEVPSEVLSVVPCEAVVARVVRSGYLAVRYLAGSFVDIESVVYLGM